MKEVAQPLNRCSVDQTMASRMDTQYGSSTLVSYSEAQKFRGIYSLIHFPFNKHEQNSCLLAYLSLLTF